MAGLRDSGTANSLFVWLVNIWLLDALQEQHRQGKGPGVTLIFVKPNGAQLTEIYKLMDAGNVKLEVAKVSCHDVAAGSDVS